MPASLPGIDLADGLSRVGGNGNLYRRLLTDFSKEYGDATGKLKEALAKGDQELAVRLAHSVKGVAGNLGARELQAAGADLEAAIAENALENIAELLEIFDQKIKTIMHGLQEMVASDEAGNARAAAKKQGDPNVLLKLLHDLAPYVKRNRPVPCNNLMTEIRKFTWPAELSDDISQLGNLVANYQFKDALIILESLIKAWPGDD
jgi:polar amino acid transport system substrate-binding protein